MRKALIHQQVVHAQLLEGDAVVDPVVQQLALAGLQPVGLLRACASRRSRPAAGRSSQW
jgi:hypothetical protein